MSIDCFPQGRDATERSIEAEFNDLCIRGEPLDPRNPICEGFLARLDGTIAPSLDASGSKIAGGRIFIAVDEVPDDKIAKLNLADLYSDCFEAQQSFLEIYAEPIMANGNPDARAEIAALKSATHKNFGDVQASINAVCKHLEERKRQKDEKRAQTSPTGRLRRAFRAFQEHAPNIKSFLGVLPTGSEYTSLICGSLSIVFDAIDKYGKVEVEACQALEEIQNAMGNTEYAAEIYRDDPGVHRCLSAVCACIFNLLGCILRWTNQSRFKKFIKPLMTPATYGSQLGDLMSSLRVKTNNLLNRTNMLHHARTLQIYNAAAKMSPHEKLERAAQNVLLRNVYQVVFSQNQKIDILEQNARYVNTKFSQQLRLNAPPPLRFNVDEVLSELGYNASLVRDDCDRILRGSRLDIHERRKVKELTNHIRLQAFVEVNSSSVLLVQGGSPDKPRSAVSSVSANMVEALSHVCGPARAICVLAYFCGEHTDDQLPFSSPSDLIITLILQLIDQCRRIDPRVLAKAKILQNCRNPTVKQLCGVLDGLLSALPEDIVLFCILDGIGFFESPSKREEMSMIVDLLSYHARERQQGGGGARIKSLFTTPSKCLVLQDLFEGYETFTLRKSSHSAAETLLPSRSWGSSGLYESISALSDSEA